MNNFVNIIFLMILYNCSSIQAGKVVYAVNAGGDSHIDSANIKYLADPLTLGVGSDYGKRQGVDRLHMQDQALYQTERWHDQSFAYDIPVKEDGEYVLVLKFAEVYFYGPNQKVFNVRLNDQHLILEDFDIYARVGHSVAHDEIIPLTIKKGKLSVNGEFSTFNGNLKLELVKGAADNPKICAFYLMQGTPDEVPKLPEIQPRRPQETAEEEGDDESMDEEEDLSEPASKKTSSKNRNKLKSGPPAADPYAEDNSSYVMPIMIAFAVFIPSLLCVCRL